MFPCSIHASLVCRDLFSQINLLSVFHATIQHHYDLYYWYCSLDVYDGANGSILVPWALRKCQTLYKDAKGLIMV